MANTNTPNTETNSILDVLNTGTPDGSTLGQSTSDKISFYGKVPYAQKAGTVMGSAVSTASGTASSFGAQVSASNATATTWTRYAANSTGIAATTALQAVLADVVETLVGLGLNKGS